MNSYLYFLPVAGVLFAIVLAVVPVFARLAMRCGLVDQPDERKRHEGAVPLVGGLAIFTTYIGYLLWHGQALGHMWPSLLALVMLLVLGAVDDWRNIRPIIKFMTQIVATCLIVFVQGIQINSLGNLFGLGEFELGFMAIPFSFACVMLLINAINLMDGLDGLAGGLSFIILGWFSVAALNVPTMLFLIAPLMAGIAGFLVYNMRAPWRSKASVFLGDAGALCLGLVIAWFALSMGMETGRMIEPIAVAWILAVPIMDQCAQFYRRVRAGRHPFSPDRGHFHHHFIDAGFAPGVAVVIILVLSFVMGAMGYLGIYLGVPQVILTSLWIFMLLLHMALTDRVGFYVGLLKGLKDRLS